MKNLRVVAVTRSTVLLQWTPSPGVDGYEITRRSEGRDPGLIAAVPGPLFMDPGLDPNVRYAYRVVENRPVGFVPVDDDDVDVMRTSARTLPELEFPDRTAFFREFLAPTFARAKNATTWCESWQDHEEAFWLVGELWNSYEASRPLDPPGPPDGGRMAWAVHYAYPALDRLFQADGAFKGCHRENVENGGLWHEPQAQPLPG